MKGGLTVGVEQRLLDDAREFEKQAACLDEEGFYQRTLAALGIPPDQDMAVSDASPAADRTQRPAVRRGSASNFASCPTD